VTVIAVFGSLLTPYVLVWQTSSRREEAWPESDLKAGVVVNTTPAPLSLRFSVIRLW